MVRWVPPHYDTIEKRDFKWTRDNYSVVVPGLMEWYERYLQYVANPSPGFDWKGWHRDGLLFTEQIYLSLPFSAYVNSRLLIRSLYRSIMTHLGSLKDNAATRLFQSNILECYIDDKRYKHISFFRNNPKLANFIGPAIETVRKYFQDIYDSIIDEGESV